MFKYKYLKYKSKYLNNPKSHSDIENDLKKCENLDYSNDSNVNECK